MGQEQKDTAGKTNENFKYDFLEVRSQGDF
jgi:hypothetical protein